MKPRETSSEEIRVRFKRRRRSTGIGNPQRRPGGCACGRETVTLSVGNMIIPVATTR